VATVAHYAETNCDDNALIGQQWIILRNCIYRQNAVDAAAVWLEIFSGKPYAFD
jgi:hypothetical protein